MTRAADTARATGDTRSKGQPMADTLVDSVLGAAAKRDAEVTRWDTQTTADPDTGRDTAADSGTGVGVSLGW